MKIFKTLQKNILVISPTFANARDITSEADLKGGVAGARPPYFLQPLVSSNHFAELEAVLFEVELIIHNSPLKYVYPNTKETCLLPNHLLFGRQLLCSSNSTITVTRNLTVLSCTTDKINHISNQFWDRWRYEYVVSLR